VCGSPKRSRAESRASFPDYVWSDARNSTVR
jgi:hypothetical protein